jgi:hypothetical protein
LSLIILQKSKPLEYAKMEKQENSKESEERERKPERDIKKDKGKE